MNNFKKLILTLFTFVVLMFSFNSNVYAAENKVSTSGEILNFSGYVDVHVDPDFVHSYINGKEAKIRIFNENFVELHDPQSGITVSLSKGDNNIWDASWTGKNGKKGILHKIDYTVKKDNNEGYTPTCTTEPGKRAMPCK